MILQTRRSLIVGMASLLAAPAIVRVSSLMPVKVIDDCLHDAEMLRLLINHQIRFTKNFINLMQLTEDDIYKYDATGISTIRYY